uniref:Uncharacterized protein n=1 Tax=Oryza glumipatula TaxID=40148 RepID=A0A0D9Y4V7_9ORYZ
MHGYGVDGTTACAGVKQEWGLMSATDFLVAGRLGGDILRLGSAVVFLLGRPTYVQPMKRVWPIIDAAR